MPWGRARARALGLLGFAVVFAVVAVWVNVDADAQASDQAFFPFIAVFFAVLSLPFFLRWLVLRRRARRADRWS